MSQPPQTNTATSLGDELDTKIAQIEDERLEDAAQTIARQAGLRYINLRFFPLDTSALFMLDEKEAREARVAPIAKNGKSLTIAVENPSYPATINLLHKLEEKGYVSPTLIITSMRGLESAWERFAYKKTERDTARGILSINEDEILNLEN